ncbi:hypothetical protein RFF05_03560 [Bengtsoniella intestinalis]|uniref:hypothetical protein n=1 Tax=Bengtsoniella intestinalis TaxID=3073143 RepID=UPI00391F1E94
MTMILMGAIGLLVLGTIAGKVLSYRADRRAEAIFVQRVRESKSNGTYLVSTYGLYD